MKKDKEATRLVRKCKQVLPVLLAAAVVASAFGALPVIAYANGIYSFHEDFESYDENTYPSSFTLKYNGSGDANQKIVTTTGHDGSNSKVFRLEGVNSWASEHYVTLPDPLPATLTIDAYVKPVIGSWPGSIGLGNYSASTWRTDTASVGFSVYEKSDTTTMTATAGTSGQVQIGTYDMGTWYKVTLVCNLESKIYDVYIDDTLAKDNIEMHPTVVSKELILLAGNTGTNEIYFDNVSIFEGEPQWKWTDGITSQNQYPFGGGDGSSEDLAYEIATREQLAQLAYNVNAGNNYEGKHFCLTNDIDISGKEWVPIGPSQSVCFKGHFDGNGHQIDGLAITCQAQSLPWGASSYLGLFGYLDTSGAISNLTVASGAIDINVTSNTVLYAAAVAAHSEGFVKNCVNRATISVVNDKALQICAGGIVGSGNWSNRIEDCRNEADITAKSPVCNAGGIIGYQLNTNEHARLNNCHNTGNITGLAWAGGIAGHYPTSSAGISNCSNSGAIIAGPTTGIQQRAGGIVGEFYQGPVTNCFNTGSVTVLLHPDAHVSNYFCAGIVGQNQCLLQIRNCYNTGKLTGTLGGTWAFSSQGSSAHTNCYLLEGSAPWDESQGGTVLSDDQMKGLAASQIGYTDSTNSLASFGPDNGAFLYALNHGRPGEIGALCWISDASGINSGYPLLGESENTPYVVSFDSGQGTPVAARAVHPGGSIVSSPATTRTDFAFQGWFTEPAGGTEVQFPYTPVTDVTFYAQWLETSTPPAPEPPEGGDTGDDTPEVLPIIVTTKEGPGYVTNTTEVESFPVQGAASVTVSSDVINALLNKAKSTGGTSKAGRLEVSVINRGGLLGLPQDKVTQFEAILMRRGLGRIVSETQASFALSAEPASIIFDTKALEAIYQADTGWNVTISASAVNNHTLAQQSQAKVAGRPAYRFSVKNGGTVVPDFNKGYATLTVPYELQAGENPNAVVVYYLADDGSLKVVRSRYSASLKTVTFKTSCFTTFVIAHNPVSFNDVLANAWYKKAVDFIAARNITLGTGEGTYSPDAPLTRGQFVVLLMNAYNIPPEVPEGSICSGQTGSSTSSSASWPSNAGNFTDAGDTYYTDYLLKARRLGIVQGIGNDLFKPENHITRQETFVMLYNALKAIDELPALTAGKTLEDFTDADEVANWAEEALSHLVGAGMLQGSGNKLDPRTGTTRGQIAQVLYNLLSR